MVQTPVPSLPNLTPWWWSQQVPPKHSHWSTRLQCVTSQETVPSVTAMRIWNLTGRLHFASCWNETKPDLRDSFSWHYRSHRTWHVIVNCGSYEYSFVKTTLLQTLHFIISMDTQMYMYHLIGYDHKINATYSKSFITTFYKGNKQQGNTSVTFSCPARAVWQVLDHQVDTLAAMVVVLILLVVMTYVHQVSGQVE